MMHEVEFIDSSDMDKAESAEEEFVVTTPHTPACAAEGTSRGEDEAEATAEQERLVDVDVRPAQGRDLAERDRGGPRSTIFGERTSRSPESPCSRSWNG